MKSMKSVFIILFCLCLIFPVLAEEDSFWTEGPLDYNGHTIPIHAIVNDTLPEQLQQITLKGRKVTQAAFEEALGHHFTLGENFGKTIGQDYGFIGIDDFYINAWTPEGCNKNGDSNAYTRVNFDQIYPIEDDTLRTLYEECADFLVEMGYTAAMDAGYICRWNFDERKMDEQGDYIIALVPFEIEGLATEFQNQIAHRTTLEKTKKTSGGIMDAPWADFVFDSDLNLIHARMSTYQIASSKPLKGEPISWEQAAISALEHIITSSIYDAQNFTTLSGRAPDPTYDEARFWEDFSVRLVRVLPMWMPNWSNICIPGWCIQYEVYRSDTGELLTTRPYGVDIFTGEVAAYQIN